MAQTDLFPVDRYIVDTSSLVDVQNEDKPAKVWDGIYRLIDASRMQTPSAAFPEITRMADAGKIPSDAFERLKTKKGIFTIPDKELIIAAGEIVHRHAHIEAWRHSGNPADPWIVAAAKQRRWTVVTEERDTGPKKNKRIPWVCEKEGVLWIRVRHLVEKEKFFS